MKILKNSLPLILILMFSSIFVFSQAGYSSGSFSANRSNGIQSSEQIIVEEYMNYHRHRIPLPRSNESIAMDIRWGNDFVSDVNKKAVLQIGLATGIMDDCSDAPPLNLGLVIDKSGSMSSDQRLVKVKAALNKLVDRLRPEDIISITVYDTEASVIVESQKVGDGSLIKQIINNIRTGGSTNLNGGMVLGYEQVHNAFLKKGTNRLILLTDGIMNTGETNIEKVLQNSKKYNEKGIEISTIGVGYSVNFKLLSQLAKQGKGMNHFVGYSDDIEKVFINEVEALISPVAKDVKLTISYGNNLKLIKNYGYNPKISKDEISFDLNNINSGLTQVFIMEFKAENIKNNYVDVTLEFYDIKKKKTVKQTQQIKLEFENTENENYLADTEVKRNYAISKMAQSLKDMAVAYEGGKKSEASAFITLCLDEIEKMYPNPKDKDILRVLEIVKRYKKVLNA